ncbi:Os03g0227450 [Oryza sativa Japonica Group]|uniref:Os03g0227450 protein n=1 Tax=Oryza sativa subsp. japonica TaxID=39947 RepID=A0A0P0VV02_ORYSJ|nr:Os03g0227450 [Oryza sativa Japonica Group]
MRRHKRSMRRRHGEELEHGSRRPPLVATADLRTRRRHHVARAYISSSPPSTSRAPGSRRRHLPPRRAWISSSLPYTSRVPGYLVVIASRPPGSSSLLPPASCGRIPVAVAPRLTCAGVLASERASKELEDGPMGLP